VAAGCSAPAVEGYQLQGTPEGFLFAGARPGETGQGIVPGLRVQSQGTWVGDIRSDEPRTTITFTRYRGAARRADAEASREARAERLRGFSRNALGPVRDVPLTAGGTAWAWTEERFDEYGRPRSLQVSAVIAFDTVSFALELDTEVPERMTQAHLDGILASFALGRTRIHWGPTLAVAAALAAAAALLARRTRPKRATAYRLWEKEEASKSSRAPEAHPHPPEEP